MVFSSSLFLFAFLPITYIIYNMAKKISTKNFILIIASLFFYAFGRLDWLLILILSVVCNYTAGLFMTKPRYRKISLILALIVNLGLLCIFKYLNFFTASFNMLPFVEITPTNIALPIGISFFTFQGMSYVIDVYKEPTKSSKDFGKVLLYIILFPQLVAGPIVKYSDISDQIDYREKSFPLEASGIKRFTVGLVKKLFFANTLGRVADVVYSSSPELLDTPLAWLGVICYTLQIYFDFSAYSDMAIGLGRMFGFKINENFRHPYCASSVKEFWRRWHISLSSWFREYLYIPLGGNRNGVARARFNRLIVFFFTGMWHGANWTFILWGLWHGLFLFIEDLISKKNIKIPVLDRIYTLWVVAMGFMLFRAENLSQAGVMLKAMYSFTSSGSLTFENLLTPLTVCTIILGILFSLPIKDFIRSKIKTNPISEKVELIAVIAVFVLCAIKLAASSFNPFIYTQF